MLKLINDLAREGKTELIVEITEHELKRRSRIASERYRRKKGILKGGKG